MYFGCLQAVLVILKILAYTEDHADVSKRFWLMVGVTLISCVTFHLCWNRLTNCWNTGRTSGSLKINATDDEQNKSTESASSSTADKASHIDQDEANQLSSMFTIKQLLKVGKPDSVLISCAFLFLIVCSVSQSVIPYYTGLVVNYIAIERSVEKFEHYLYYLGGVTLLAGVSAGLRAGFFR